MQADASEVHNQQQTKKLLLKVRWYSPVYTPNKGESIRGLLA